MSIYQCNVPIGFFFFNRLDTTSVVFEQIRKAKPQKLYLISDGPRNNHEGEADKVREVREYIENCIDWNCEVKRNYAEENMGCKSRMASGITWLLDNEEMAIIIEDDVKPTEDFFPYMEEMLNKYKDDNRVMLVSGFKIVNDFPVADSYTFSHHPMIWGWGTWKRAWQYYDIDIKTWKQRKKEGTLKRYYNYYGYIKASRDFDCVYNHQKDTWDFQWYYTVLDQDGLVIVPKVNLIENLGFGRSDATHTTGNTNQDFSTYPLLKPYVHPDEVKVNSRYDEAYLKKGWGFVAMVKKAYRRMLRRD